LRLISGKKRGYVELEGTPDMALEILSDSSVHKDEDILRDLYWRARVPEYWLVDVRGKTLRFEILKHTAKGYVLMQPVDGWVHSTVFNRSFRLTQEVDPLGNPKYSLAVK
jgi:Uma2 family endonuclease